jgi:hypothetical protein
MHFCTSTTIAQRWPPSPWMAAMAAGSGAMAAPTVMAGKARKKLRRDSIMALSLTMGGKPLLTCCHDRKKVARYWGIVRG